MQELVDAQRALLRMFLATVAVFVTVGLVLVALTSRVESLSGSIFIAGNLVLWAAMIFLARTTYRVACAVGSSSPSLWAVGAFIAPLNLLLVLSLSSRVNEELRAQGVEVGFMGPKLP